MSSSATEFLTNLAQTVSTMTLYEEGHPARERAIDGTLDAILRLQEEIPTPDFTFVGNEIVFQGRPFMRSSGGNGARDWVPSGSRGWSSPVR